MYKEIATAFTAHCRPRSCGRQRAVHLYLTYVSFVHGISKEKGYQKLHKQTEDRINYEIASIRAIEFLMFQADLFNQLESKGRREFFFPSG